ncbi:phospho-N-acetylmuramoyl-pentapeptide-transferase-like protein isoform X1 [Hibiscus syriacus]|uniref:Phospho-N-acetylmuramoyl-pentapeptide-transferase-like protein isoform X1 n=1 Tax=Hibiscus syriacus TaxID=106335 RepID=A0A6A3BSX3_HIBSY|nr:phospho-N-acetylmuramoyl-pentapeptide-transferase-like protein isoform X1 [Hibiscus syriacus]
MGGNVEPTTVTAGPTPLSPPHDSHDLVPVGSAETEEEIEILSPLSDEDHDHAHGQDRDQNQKSRELVEYYFSDENLPTDKYMMSLIKKNKEGFVSISMIASFRRMKRLTRSYPSIVASLKESSMLVCFFYECLYDPDLPDVIGVLSSDGKKVKCRNPLPPIKVRDPKLFTVLVENLPADHSVENIRRIFGEVGHIKNIFLRDPHALEEAKKNARADILVSSKLHALVEYETVEAAEKAVTTFNDERDWRNGVHVKLLKRTSKYAPRRQPWRGPEPEKNSNARASDQIGNYENHTPSQHHEGLPDVEDGEHLSKEKNGQRPRNKGRARKPKTHGTNGLGHGTTSSSHAIEPAKPPLGPRMPDGTRGFTMGRGRPLVSK